MKKKENKKITLRVGVSSNFARRALVIYSKNPRKTIIIYTLLAMETTLSNEQSMIEFGTSLLTLGSKFLLHGDLGAGKTTLTKGIAAGLGIDPTQIVSPTYTYINIYEEKLLHIDMRRIETEQQIHTLGLLDLIDQYPYIVIEWPKREHNYADSLWQEITINQTTVGRTIVQKKYS